MKSPLKASPTTAVSPTAATPNSGPSPGGNESTLIALILDLKDQFQGLESKWQERERYLTERLNEALQATKEIHEVLVIDRPEWAGTTKAAVLLGLAKKGDATGKKSAVMLNLVERTYPNGDPVLPPYNPKTGEGCWRNKAYKSKNCNDIKRRLEFNVKNTQAAIEERIRWKRARQ